MIGVFDSGVGGLTVVKEIFKQLPQYQIIYFGDTARLPYGTKGADFVKRYSVKITDWLLKNGAKVIVVACNTSSAWASDLLKKRFPETPIFEMITPVVNDLNQSHKFSKIGIIGTPGTIKSSAYQERILAQSPNLKIFSQACPLFVPLVEEGKTDGPVVNQVCKEYLAPLKSKDIEALILACTHYPLLKKTIEKVIDGNTKIINPAESLARELKAFLKDNPKIEKQIKKGNNHRFFFSDEPYNFEKIRNLCFGKNFKKHVKVLTGF